MLRRIVTYPLTRLVIAVVIFVVLTNVLVLVLLVTGLLQVIPVAGKVIEALAGLSALLFVGLVIERRSLARIGFPIVRLLPDLGAGLLLGAVLLSLIVGVMAVAGWYRVVGFAWEVPRANAASAALIGLVATAVIAIAEEIEFRGVLFRLVEEWLGSWLALAASALFFGLAHIRNPNSSLWAAIAIAVEAGVLFGAVYILSRSLWLPIGLHWTWNFFEGWVYGTPVSGLNIPGLIRSETSGPTLWTGGAFGPEASVVAVVICGAVGLYVVVRCVQEGQMYTPPWLARLAGRPNPLSPFPAREGGTTEGG